MKFVKKYPVHVKNPSKSERVPVLRKKLQIRKSSIQNNSQILLSSDSVTIYTKKKFHEAEFKLLKNFEILFSH